MTLNLNKRKDQDGLDDINILKHSDWMYIRQILTNQSALVELSAFSDKGFRPHKNNLLLTH